MRVVSSASLARGRFEGGRLICIHASPTIATEFME